jgi:hypothetical protein
MRWQNRQSLQAISHRNPFLLDRLISGANHSSNTPIAIKGEKRNEDFMAAPMERNKQLDFGPIRALHRMVRAEKEKRYRTLVQWAGLVQGSGCDNKNLPGCTFSGVPFELSALSALSLTTDNR